MKTQIRDTFRSVTLKVFGWRATRVILSAVLFFVLIPPTLHSLNIGDDSGLITASYVFGAIMVVCNLLPIKKTEVETQDEPKYYDEGQNDFNEQGCEPEGDVLYHQEKWWRPNARTRIP